MKPLRTATFGIWVFCFLANWAWAAGPWLNDFDKARAEAQRQQRPLLIHFFSDHCLPCVQMEKTVLHQKVVEELLTKEYIAVYVNVDQHLEMAKRFSINRWPSDVIINPNTAKRLTTSTGPKPLSSYVEMLEMALVWYKMSEPTPTPPPQPGLVYDPNNLLLEGYSPVSLLKEKKWTKGTETFAVQYEGMWYLLMNAEEAKLFQSKPEKYAAQFLGCDPVLIRESPKVPAVRGTTKFAAFYDDQLYLFHTKENRDKFKETPDKYIHTQVVLDLSMVETVTR